ncbi:MAG: type IV toxin-antitoxin system AbiEi family antitoxin [Alphaproteobacteria bacterium]|nr:type IV toxin-antitoxin system AbiEi family antitoxin [Alphaproteobacteria bacterium]
MTTSNESKINKILQAAPPGTVLMSSWLASQGYSLDLQKYYKKSNWLTSLGTGASIRTGDKVDYFGGLYALQTQAGLSVHVGGRTALSLMGRGHYVDFSGGRTVLFGGAKEKLPMWFRKYDWGTRIDYYATSFMPENIGLVDLGRPGFTVKVSSAARAIMECLYLAPQNQELFECYELMEGMNDLRPQSVQELLENCSSVKVKRLFLYLAEKLKHDWLEFVDLSNVDLGSGTRSLVKNGVYIDKYKITVPKEFEKNDQPEI